MNFTRFRMFLFPQLSVFISAYTHLKNYASVKKSTAAELAKMPIKFLRDNGTRLAGARARENRNNGLSFSRTVDIWVFACARAPRKNRPILRHHDEIIRGPIRSYVLGTAPVAACETALRSVGSIGSLLSCIKRGDRAGWCPFKNVKCVSLTMSDLENLSNYEKMAIDGTSFMRKISFLIQWTITFLCIWFFVQLKNFQYSCLLSCSKFFSVHCLKIKVFVH